MIKIIDTHRRGPRICCIASIHGNEAAACNAQFIKHVCRIVQTRLRRGSMEIYFCVNTSGQRELHGSDINREFYNRATLDIVQRIQAWLRGADLVLDFHEGWGQHIVQPESMGCSITGNIYARKRAPHTLARMLSMPGYCDLRACGCWRDIPGTLHDWCTRMGIAHVLIETRGQKSSRALAVRRDIVHIIAHAISCV